MIKRASRVKILLGLLAAMIVAAVVIIVRLPTQPPEKIRVRIVRFGGSSSKWQPSRIYVVAVDEKDRMSSESVNSADFTCSIGDTVAATRYGVSFSMDLRSCFYGGHGIR